MGSLSAAQLIELARQAALAVLLILVTLAVGRRVKRRVAHTGLLAARDPAVAALISNLIYVGIIALGVSTALTGFGVDLTAVFTALGVTGLAVSLALQDVLRNFVAGIYILLEKPFNIGDRIALRDLSGEVQGIELRTTLLRTSTGAQVIVPNSIVMTDIVTNRSLDNLQAYTIRVCGDRELGRGALSEYRGLLESSRDVAADPEPEVTIESVEAAKTTLRLRFHTPKGAAVVPSLVERLEEQHPGATVTAALQEP